MIKRVGVIGGGQLAWMMADAAKKLNLELIVQTPQASDPAVAIATHTILAPVDDAIATAQLAACCDVITFENEFVNLEALSPLAQQGVRFCPQLEAIAPLLDKYHQRCYLGELGLPTPKFAAFEEIQHRGIGAGKISGGLDAFDFPVVLKVRRHGYDGQGTFVLKSRSDAEAVLSQLKQQLLLEEFVPFERELAIMAARSLTGEMITYPVVETQQEAQVCRRVLVTPDLAPEVIQQAEAIAHTLLESLKFVGILGIEFFLTPAGNLLVNEIAPRTHNSGHFTLDACAVSQFEQQLRAVCGLPLGDPTLQCLGAVMVNLLGYETSEFDYLDKRQQLAQLPQTYVHWYGKSTSRPGRKLGHVTALLNPELSREGRSQALEIAKRIEAIWYPS